MTYPSQRCLLSRLMACLISSTRVSISARIGNPFLLYAQISADHIDWSARCKVLRFSANALAAKRLKQAAASALYRPVDVRRLHADRRALGERIHADDGIAVGRSCTRLEGFHDHIWTTRRCSHACLAIDREDSHAFRYAEINGALPLKRSFGKVLEHWCRETATGKTVAHGEGLSYPR